MTTCAVAPHFVVTVPTMVPVGRVVGTDASAATSFSKRAVSLSRAASSGCASATA